MSELFREGLRKLEQEEERRTSPAALQDLGAVVRAIQHEARRAGLDKMSMREIDAEVTAARKAVAAGARKSGTRPGR